MSILVKSGIAEDLARALQAAATKRSFGWRADRGLLTSTDAELTLRAWFRLDLYEHGLLFTILAPKGEVLSHFTYASYHGRMVETLLRHFSPMIERITADPAHMDLRL